MDRAEQLRIFNESSPAERAAIVQRQIARWRDNHRDELTAGQVAVLDECIAYICPEHYVRPITPDTPPDPVREELFTRTARLLGLDYFVQAMTLRGDDMPSFHAEAFTIENVPHAGATLAIASASMNGATVRVEIRPAGEATLVLPPVPDVHTSPFREFALRDLLDESQWEGAGSTVKIAIEPPPGARIQAAVRTIDPATGKAVFLRPEGEDGCTRCR